MKAKPCHACKTLTTLTAGKTPMCAACYAGEVDEIERGAYADLQNVGDFRAVRARLRSAGIRAAA